MKPVNIAMLSLTHGHSRKYYQVLKENRDLNFVGASAETPEVRALFERANPGIPCYDSDAELFAGHPELEAVVVASANHLHAKQTIDCAERGLHVLSMKIPSFDPGEYAAMEAAVQKAGVVCQVELELHYNPAVRRLRERAGTVGRLRSFQATNITLSPVWAFPWQGVPEMSYGRRVSLREGDTRCRGGALCDHPHVFDLLRWVSGSEFETLFAEVAPNLRTDLEVEDMLMVSGRMRNGVVFSLDPSWSRMEERLRVPGPGWEVFPKRMEVNVTLVGDEGVLMADCFGPNVYHNGAPNDRYTVQYTYFDEWIGMMDEFIDCIRTGRTPALNLSWHRPTIQAMNACYDSIASGQPVNLTE